MAWLGSYMNKGLAKRIAKKSKGKIKFGAWGGYDVYK